MPNVFSAYGERNRTIGRHSLMFVVCVGLLSLADTSNSTGNNDNFVFKIAKITIDLVLTQSSLICSQNALIAVQCVNPENIIYARHCLICLLS